MLYDFTLSEYLITLNGLPYDGAREITEDGKYLLEISAQDEVGHETKGKAEFIVDGTAPLIVFGGAENNKVNYEPVTLTISLKDEQDFITSLSVNNQNREIQENGQQRLQFQDFGEYEIQVLAEDLAGNTQTEKYTVIYKKESVFSKWYSNKPVFYSTVLGTAAVIGIGSAYAAVSLKRKKSKEN